jgi:multicomponent Na+:H+ antiporter subunit C
LILGLTPRVVEAGVLQLTALSAWLTLTIWATPVLEAFVFATILCGFFGILLKKNLLMKIIAMDVMSTGVIAYYVVIAARDGTHTPILSGSLRSDYADPVPQAVILTAIVIGFSIQALMLVGVMKLSRDNPTLETSEIEKQNQPPTPSSL